MNAHFLRSLGFFCATAVSLAAPPTRAANIDEPNRPAKVAAPRLSEKKAVEIAMAAMLKNGRKLEDYQEPMTMYSAKKHSWQLIFMPKSRVIGDDVSVSVDDRTHSTKISQGY